MIDPIQLPYVHIDIGIYTNFIGPCVRTIGWWTQCARVRISLQKYLYPRKDRLHVRQQGRDINEILQEVQKEIKKKKKQYWEVFIFSDFLLFFFFYRRANGFFSLQFCDFLDTHPIYFFPLISVKPRGLKIIFSTTWR